MTFFLVDVWQIRVDLAQTLSPCFDVFDVLGELLISWESVDDHMYQLADHICISIYIYIYIDK